MFEGDEPGAVIRAHYGLTDYVDVHGERCYFFGRERAAAMRFIATRLQPHYTDLDLPVFDLLVARVRVSPCCSTLYNEGRADSRQARHRVAVGCRAQDRKNATVENLHVPGATFALRGPTLLTNSARQAFSPRGFNRSMQRLDEIVRLGFRS
ncbi:hypothetical protein [Burkholderia pseudomallei]|uniref:hypothetical protein n=1 Tax=Burkholderia pseudomallei TaxID=28450 RepID=UPI0011781203|nr:hypothetical protein [Burkholderia pseudomallei]